MAVCALSPQQDPPREFFEGVASAAFIVLPSSEFYDGDFAKYLLHQRKFVDFAMRPVFG